MNRRTSRFSGEDAVSIVLFTLLALDATFPLARALGLSVYLCAACVLWWAVLTFRTGTIAPSGAVSWLFLILSVALPYGAGFTSVGNRYLNLVILSLGPQMYAHYQRRRPEVLGWVWRITLTLSLVTWCITAFRLTANPWIARSIKSSGEYSLSVLRQGIGGYDFVYYCVILGVCGFGLFISEARAWRMRFLGLGLFLGGLLLSLLANYLTATLVLAAGSVLALTLRLLRIRDPRKRWTALAALALLTVLVAAWGGALLQLLSRLSGGGRISVTLASGGSLMERLSKEFLQDRWPTLRASLVTARDYPLLGLMSFGGGQTDLLAQVGQHSHLLDTFAFLGVGLGICNLYVCFQTFLRPLPGSRGLRGPVFFSCLLILLLNNATPSIGIAMAWFYPLLCRETEKKR